MVATTTGERYDFKHKPVPVSGNRYCGFVLPSGDVCRRSINWISTDWGDYRESKGHWRHSPRPYSNY